MEMAPAYEQSEFAREMGAVYEQFVYVTVSEFAMEMTAAYEQFVYVTVSEFAWEMAAVSEQFCLCYSVRDCLGDGCCS